MNRNRGSVLATILVVVLAIVGSKNPDPVQEVPDPPWWRRNMGFVLVMAFCAALGLGIVFLTGNQLEHAWKPLPSPLIPPPWGLRIIAAILIVAPLALGLGLLCHPAAAPERQAIAKNEILAPWAGVLLFVVVAGEWLNDYLTLELQTLIFVLPWVGAAKTLMHTPLQSKSPSPLTPTRVEGEG